MTLQTQLAPQLGSHVEAVADYSRAILLEPSNSYAHYNLGITRDRLGGYSGAVEDFGAAIALDPLNPDFYHNRGFSLRKKVCVCVLGASCVSHGLRAL